MATPVVSRVCLRPSVLRCWRALLLCVLPFCNLFPRTYIRLRLIVQTNGVGLKYQMRTTRYFLVCTAVSSSNFKRLVCPSNVRAGGVQSLKSKSSNDGTSGLSHPFYTIPTHCSYVVRVFSNSKCLAPLPQNKCKDFCT